MSRAAGAAVYVPERFWAETSSALWRLSRGPGALLTAGEAMALPGVLLSAPLRSEPLAPLAGRSLEISCATGATTCDASYVALAELRGARLWTADGGLAGLVTGTEWGGLVARLPGSG